MQVSRQSSACCLQMYRQFSSTYSSLNKYSWYQKPENNMLMNEMKDSSHGKNLKLNNFHSFFPHYSQFKLMTWRWNEKATTSKLIRDNIASNKRKYYLICKVDGLYVDSKSNVIFIHRHYLHYQQHGIKMSQTFILTITINNVFKR